MGVFARIISLFIIVFLSTCATSKKSINKAFYSELGKQLNRDYFSPVDFAGQFKPKEHKINWELDDIEITSGRGDNQIQLRLRDICLHRGDNSELSKYIIHLYGDNGKKTSISSLSNGEKKGDRINFDLQEKAVNISITPFDGFFKWDIVPYHKEKVDSIVIQVNAEGPYFGGGERYVGTKLNGRTVSNQPNDHYWDPPKTEITQWGNPHEPGHFYSYEPTYFQLAFYWSQPWVKTSHFSATL